VQIGEATVRQYRDMGHNLPTAKDFLEHHERLEDDIKARRAEIDEMTNMADQLTGANDDIARTVKDKSRALREQWDALLVLVDGRLRLGLSYVNFHKKAQQVAVQMDAIEQFLQIEKLDPTQVSDESMKHKESKYQEVVRNVGELDGKGRAFIRDASESYVSSLNPATKYTDYGVGLKCGLGLIN
jgi:hypothetical protein